MNGGQRGSRIKKGRARTPAPQNRPLRRRRPTSAALEKLAARHGLSVETAVAFGEAFLFLVTGRSARNHRS
jgi:hypothetical protein